MKTNVISPRGWRTTQAGCRALRALYACSSDPPGDVDDGRESVKDVTSTPPANRGWCSLLSVWWDEWPLWWLVCDVGPGFRISTPCIAKN